MQPMVRSACLTSSRTVPKSFEVAEMKTLTGASGSFASLLRVAMREDQRQFYISQSVFGSFLSSHRHCPIIAVASDTKSIHRVAMMHKSAVPTQDNIPRGRL